MCGICPPLTSFWRWRSPTRPNLVPLMGVHAKQLRINYKCILFPQICRSHSRTAVYIIIIKLYRPITDKHFSSSTLCCCRLHIHSVSRITIAIPILYSMGDFMTQLLCSSQCQLLLKYIIHTRPKCTVQSRKTNINF
jgi:hypothetical protein